MQIGEIRDSRWREVSEIRNSNIWVTIERLWYWVKINWWIIKDKLESRWLGYVGHDSGQIHEACTPWSSAVNCGVKCALLGTGQEEVNHCCKLWSRCPLKDSNPRVLSLFFVSHNHCSRSYIIYMYIIVYIMQIIFLHLIDLKLSLFFGMKLNLSPFFDFKQDHLSYNKKFCSVYVLYAF